MKPDDCWYNLIICPKNLIPFHYIYLDMENECYPCMPSNISSLAPLLVKEEPLSSPDLSSTNLLSELFAPAANLNFVKEEPKEAPTSPPTEAVSQTNKPPQSSLIFTTSSSTRNASSIVKNTRLITYPKVSLHLTDSLAESSSKYKMA